MFQVKMFYGQLDIGRGAQRAGLGWLGCDLGPQEPGPPGGEWRKAAVQGQACSARSYRYTFGVTALEFSFPHSLRSVLGGGVGSS